MNNQKSLMDAMAIDCEKTADCIVSFLKQKVGEEQKEGICLGISGGVDSAVIATLAVKAIGDPLKVHGLHLPDLCSQKKFEKLAQNLAEKLEIQFQVKRIDMLLKEQGYQDPSIFKLFRISTLLNRLGVSLFNYGHSFVKWRSVIKKEGYGGKNSLKSNSKIPSSLSKMFIIPDKVASCFAKRHIMRRQILENYAYEKNLLLVGAANRTEYFIGWFVMGGVDDLRIEAILGLYKNQVVQLARFLDVPAGILEVAPSPDMMKGIRDTDIIGFSYDILDRVAYAVEHDLGEEAAFREGIEPEEFEDILKLNQCSSSMRENEHEFPPFD